MNADHPTDSPARPPRRRRRGRQRNPGPSLRLAIACLLLVTTAAGAQPVPAPQETPASRSGSRPAAPAPQQATRFQPGVTIDWSAPAVRVAGRVVLRAGPLEFLACFPGKEHESIVLLEASAVHVYMALGLIGLSPGRPPVWDDAAGRFLPPSGDLVDVSFEWVRDGRRQRAAAAQWLREMQYARPPLPRPWVFAGSQRLRDGTLAADQTGAGVALVDFPDSLLALSRSHTSRDADLWVAARTAAIPPERTPVRLVLRPARRPRYDVRLDFRGAAFVDGRYVSPEDLSDLLRLARRLDPDGVQAIRVQAALRSDVARLRRALDAGGVPAAAVRLVRPKRPSSQPAEPPTGQRQQSAEKP